MVRLQQQRRPSKKADDIPSVESTLFHQKTSRRHSFASTATSEDLEMVDSERREEDVSRNAKLQKIKKAVTTLVSNRQKAEDRKYSQLAGIINFKSPPQSPQQQKSDLPADAKKLRSTDLRQAASLFSLGLLQKESERQLEQTRKDHRGRVVSPKKQTRKGRRGGVGSPRTSDALTREPKRSVSSPSMPHKALSKAAKASSEFIRSESAKKHSKTESTAESCRGRRDDKKQLSSSDPGPINKKVPNGSRSVSTRLSTSRRSRSRSAGANQRRCGRPSDKRPSKAHFGSDPSLRKNPSSRDNNSRRLDRVTSRRSLDRGSNHRLRRATLSATSPQESGRKTKTTIRRTAGSYNSLLVLAKPSPLSVGNKQRKLQESRAVLLPVLNSAPSPLTAKRLAQSLPVLDSLPSPLPANNSSSQKAQADSLPCLDLSPEQAKEKSEVSSRKGRASVVSNSHASFTSVMAFNSGDLDGREPTSAERKPERKAAVKVRENRRARRHSLV